MPIHAYAAKQPHAKLEPFVYDEPALGPFDVLIEVTHCGLCHSDIHLIDDDWKRSTYPLVPGHEVVGKITKKGSSVESPLGMRVGVGWMKSSCLRCSLCLSGETQICQTKKLTCIGHHGAFADHLVADSRFIYAIPDAMDSAIAAPLLCAGATVYSPLRNWHVQAPQSVAVLGIGGLGHLALQFARAFGCEVTAISSTKEKEKEALSFGASRFLTYDEIAANPAAYALSFDFMLSTIHSDLNWNQMMTLLKPMGTLCFLGRPSQPLVLDVASVLSTQRNICGSSTANRAIMNEMLAFAARHKIAPKIELMPMSEINTAIEKLRHNKARYRIVLTR